MATAKITKGVSSRSKETTFSFIRKRDGRIVPFDDSRITNAVLKALVITGEGSMEEAEKVSAAVMAALLRRRTPESVPNIEDIQDIVETQLILMDFAKTAKSYILYRSERMKIREDSRSVPEHVKKLVKESRQYFRNLLSEFIYYRTYSRWIEDEGRRETWIETVDRYMGFMKERLDDAISTREYADVREAILKQETMPSMRLFWAAGKAARANNVTAFNCSFTAPTKLGDFAEIMYLAMSGAGVGFSVESQTVEQLPQIKAQTGKFVPTHVVKDSKDGWCDALTAGLVTWFAGKDIKFDYTQVRAQGARLRTMGGKASGPEPLRDLLTTARAKVLSKQNRRLSTLDVHDLICKIGEIVVVGGVRRTALISLSDLHDEELRHAKDGAFYLKDPQRAMANNSAVYLERPSAVHFMEEWLALAQSGSGERGIFNRGGLVTQMPARRTAISKKHMQFMGTNPCGEITLRSKEFCNLSEVVCRKEDTEESLIRKIRTATLMGTYQCMLTDFNYIGKEWKKNCDEERLLGVSLTGQWDCPAVRSPKVLKYLREEAIRVNEKYAKKFGINASSSITCVKPSGNVSQLVDASSGMHPRHAEQYIRRVRIGATDSLFNMMRDQKVTYHSEVGQPVDTASVYVLDFPVQAPKSSTYKDGMSAIEQLEYWKMVKENFTEHNPSVTVSIGDEEWLGVADWIYKNWDMTGGLSFLPRNNHVYALAPYEAIDKERYKELAANFPTIDFSQIVLYERDDQTQGSKEAACVAGVCEI